MGQGRAGFTPLDVQLHLAAGGTVKDARSLSVSPTIRTERDGEPKKRVFRPWPSGLGPLCWIPRILDSGLRLHACYAPSASWQHSRETRLFPGRIRHFQNEGGSKPLRN